MKRLVDREIIEQKLAQLEEEISMLEDNLNEKLYKKKMGEEQFIERVDAIDDCLTEVGYCMEGNMFTLARKRERRLRSASYEILSNHG
ncbi:hypothetical protein [Metabacillus fastidiosus]|uniref:hypothetical protein n=1 Tax=Metabacillus fastidiosus TaxID=1458 RepID=UPI002DBA9116|nr:hypothetical protein [Metabacillus fastidiosus]MEC2075874.1 hypothetical protein [Metabacillus fastidiosus]